MGDPPNLRSVVYVPSGLELNRWLKICAETVEAHGWDLTAIVRHWDDVRQLLRAGLLDTLVVGHPGHLDPQRIPRVVAAGGLPVPVTTEVRPEQRRPVIYRPGPAGR
jgi:hypothetical protein